MRGSLIVQKRATLGVDGLTQRTRNENWSLGWSVWANQSNRLMGLTFHGLVLSDKVKGTTAVVL